MPGGKNNTQRIETLQTQAATLSARNDVFDTIVKGINELLTKCTAAAEGHGTRITVIEQQVLILDLRAALATVASLREELVAVRKDIEGLHAWKVEQKKNRDEASRRWWSFGPNITAAIISGFISLVGILIAYYLNRSK